jgi:succinoglycan biosynthesis protein ExoM
MGPELTSPRAAVDDASSPRPVERTPRPDHVSVCICTYKRADGLSRLLDAIDKQETAGLFTYSVVVVDNDRTESAKPIVGSFATRSAHDVSYVCEPQQNISLARNRAVNSARGEFVALIDDDEWPQDDWLLRMYEAIKQYASDGVLGPVKPHFEKQPPRWVERGKFFEKPRRGRHQTGSVLRWTETRTSNVFLRSDVFTGSEAPFDPALGLGGGEDVEFFSRTIAHGRVFVWCQEAPVFEMIPPERCERKFMLRRALLRGRMSLLLPTSGARDTLKSVVAVTLYTLALPILFVVGHHVFMTYLIKCCDHLGKLLTLCRLRVVEEKYAE